MIKRKVKFLITAIVLSLASHTVFAKPINIEESIYNSNNLIYKSIAEYYLFSALESDPFYSAAIDYNITLIDSEMSLLAQSSEPKIANNISPINKQWEEYKALLLSNQQYIQTNGFADGQNEYRMGELNMQLSTALHHLYDITSKTNDNPITHIARAQSIDLRMIVAIFSAQYTVNPEQIYSGEISEKTLNERLDMFTKNLRKLSRLNADKHVMKSINSKWNMISASIKTKQKRVPFLVSKYSDLIIRDLEKLQ
jgi:hypothetical protein